MHKALHCTCSQQPPLLSPLFLISFDITQSLLLDLCLCNPLSCITPQIISLSIFSCGASLLITVVWLMDLWILDLLLPHSFNFSCPGPFLFPLSSLSSHSHVYYLWLIVMSIFFHFCSTLTLLIDVLLYQSNLLDKLTFPLFLCTLRVPPLGSMMGACS